MCSNAFAYQCASVCSLNWMHRLLLLWTNAHMTRLAVRVDPYLKRKWMVLLCVIITELYKLLGYA